MCGVLKRGGREEWLLRGRGLRLGGGVEKLVIVRLAAEGAA